MPDPITTQLINGVWDTINDAVTSGLAMTVPYDVPRPSLDTVAVVSAEKIKATGGWECIEHPDAPTHIPSAHVRVEQSGDAFDVMHHYELGYHDLQALDSDKIKDDIKDKIKDWATAARQFELDVTLRYYAEHAEHETYNAVDKLSCTNPDGWGQRRWVVFSPATGRTAIPAEWEGADLEHVVKVGPTPVDGIQALVYRIGGGPYVRRPADLSLGWTPLDHCRAELLLTEQLEFVNAGLNTKTNTNTIIGVRIDPSASNAAQPPPAS